MQGIAAPKNIGANLTSAQLALEKKRNDSLLAMREKRNPLAVVQFDLIVL